MSIKKFYTGVYVGDNLGVGTVSPSEKFHVAGGSGLIESTTYADAGFTISDSIYDYRIGTTPPEVRGNYIAIKRSSSNTLFQQSSGDFIWQNVSSEKMRITSAGNVGIGTTSPAHKLTVNAPNDTTAVGIDFPSAHFDFSANSTSGYTTSFHMDNTGTTIGSNSAGRALIFQTNTTDRLYINGNTGNVGIGTTSPGAKLHVQGDSSGYLFRVQGTSTLNVYDPGAAAEIGVGSGSGDKLKLFSNDSINNGITIDTSGNVGIGTASPAANLQIGDGSTGAVSVYIGGSLSSEQTLGFSVNGNNIYHNIVSNANTGEFRFNAGAAGAGHFLTFRTGGNSERMRITSAGDTGIGVTTPRAKLDVAGGVKVADDTDSASANKVGTLRYRYVPGSPKNFSYVDMCMQTGASSYAWVNIVQNAWN